MAVDWTNYLDLAQDLQSDGATEDDVAKNRASVSRAYYAAFNEAKKYAPPSATKGVSAHSSLIQHFQERGGDHESIGDMLDTLRERRNEADYEADKYDSYPAQWATRAQVSVELTEKLLERLSNI